MVHTYKVYTMIKARNKQCNANEPYLSDFPLNLYRIDCAGGKGGHAAALDDESFDGVGCSRLDMGLIFGNRECRLQVVS